MRSRAATSLFVLLLTPLLVEAQNLEIHIINVGWGQATFIQGPGPTGKTVLLEAGDTGKGTAEVLPYLQSIGHLPSAGFDYTVAGHQHCDHVGGMDEVIGAGYDVRVRNYDNGSSYTSSCVDGWNAAAAGTTAGAPVAITPGTVIDLGGGATLTCVVVDGEIIGGQTVAVSNENDRSIGLLLEYGGFDYLWASDLGGGDTDFNCTGRSTSQLDVEGPMIAAISPGGASPLISSGGIDVLHVSHHGSESSTNPDYFNFSEPAVAVISTGAGQSSTWHLPRIDVVENVLLGQATSCVIAPPTLVLQTEEGAPTGSNTSFAGYCVGDIVISTDGTVTFHVGANGAVTQGPNEIGAAVLPRSFTIDDSSGGGGGDTTPPTTSITAPSSGATVSGTTLVTASASDDVGVARVEFFLDGILQATDPSSPYEWSWDTTAATNGSHSLTSKAFDAAENSGTSAPITAEVSNGGGTTPGDVSGWTVTQANATWQYVIPAGTVIPDEGYLVIARDATKAQFESFWGVALPSNVVFLNSAGAMPQINGDENYALTTSTGASADGPTISMSAGASQSIRRNDPCSAAGSSGSWTVSNTDAANPGTGAAAGCAGGVKINEFSDAVGTGNFIYEFVELHNDVTADGGGTPPPSGINLSATGYKDKGLQKADLSWSGATSTNVDVYRDGIVIVTTPNDGFYTDPIDVKGGGTYTYEVCESGTTTCSNEATASF